MFGPILAELFPTDCRVLLRPDGHYVYPIFKNGSTSLYESGYKVISADKVKHNDNVEVYVRPPHNRFVSGVQTYLSQLGPTVNKDTALYFIEQYLYLNRHFCPQLFWLIHLRRFTTAKFVLKPLSELKLITNRTANQTTVDIDLAKRLISNPKFKFYNEMDEVLTVNLIGQTVSLEEIFAVLKSNYGRLYRDTFENLKNIIDVVP